MSISTETQRLIQAKVDLKASIEKRGAYVSTDNKIDTYANILDACPFGISGTFIPEESTKTFSIEGLPFTPTSLMILCPDEIALGSSRTPDIIVCLSTHKDMFGSIMYTDSSGGNRLGTISPTSSIISWNDSGVTVCVPSSLTAKFKKGLVYNYYITGGIE